jgi:hypothetical protein
MATPVLNSPVLDECEVESFSTVMLKDVFAGPMLASSSSEAFARSGELDCVCDSSVEDGSCLKGFFMGIGLEAGAAMGIYSICLLWHILR